MVKGGCVVMTLIVALITDCGRNVTLLETNVNMYVY